MEKVFTMLQVEYTVSKKYLEYSGAKLLDGYQLRYIYFIDKSYKDKLTVPILPFSTIEELNARMYKGKKINMRV